MDPKLAEVYKTNEASDADLEALATAELAEKLAAADEVNVDGMSDEEAEALASQILDGDSAAAEEPETEEQVEEETAEEGEEKTAAEGEELSPEQEKIAEADYLGRVMAHAYVAERKEIEKAAAAEKAKTAAAQAPKVKVAAPKVKVASKGKVMEHLEKGKKTKKASAEETQEESMSALDRLAVARAHEILKASGIDPDAEQEKKSSVDEEKAALLQAKVEERAQAMLTEAGYTFEAPAAEEPAEGDKA